MAEGGQTAEHPSAFTVDSLKQYFEAVMSAEARLRGEQDRRYEQRFEAQEKAVHAALAAVQRSAEVLEASTLQWRGAQNEWRGALEDRNRADVARLRDFTPRTELTALVDRLDKIEARLDMSQGRSSGLTAGWTYLIGAIGLAAAVIGILVGTR